MTQQETELYVRNFENAKLMTHALHQILTNCQIAFVTDRRPFVWDQCLDAVKRMHETLPLIAQIIRTIKAERG